MNWYVVTIVMSTPEYSTTQQFREQVRLISAASTEEAFLKGRMVGLNQESNSTLEFINVTDVVLLETVTDGMEVCSHLREEKESVAYIRKTHERAVMIRNEFIG